MSGKKKKQSSWQGIAPDLLVKQVENTAPFLFTEANDLSSGSPSLPPGQRYLEILRRQRAIGANDLSHTDYFALCLAAHFASVGSFVPTDVDNQIRLKIWQTAPTPAVIEEMVPLVEEFLTWDIYPVTTRYVRSTTDTGAISGLEGEWLGEAAAAYSALRKISTKRAQEFIEQILFVLEREHRILEENLRAKNNLEVLKAAMLIAHNLGDLDRVIDLWELPQDDPLRKLVYKVGHEPNAHFARRFLFAGELNKKYMAAENHRHFPLREPKILRERAAYLLPLGPFFDDWGQVLGRDQQISERDLAEVLSALIRGFSRVPGAVGYGRALAGLAHGYFGSARALKRLLPAKLVKDWEANPLQQISAESREAFEQRWWRLPWELYREKYLVKG